MEEYKKEFINFMVQSQVLKFGSFTLKSGRQSPFFMNAGAYITGAQLKKLGEYYAKAVHDNFGDDIDVFFGPAYKGIPLAVTTAIAYSELYGKEIKSKTATRLLLSKTLQLRENQSKKFIQKSRRLKKLRAE